MPKQLLLHVSLVLLLCCGRLMAQYPVGISKALDIPEKGWNKTLLLNNGNTALLHVQNHEPIAIYIFDKDKKLIATSKELSAYIDINLLELASVKGLYEIGGELVLFMQQDEKLKKNLVRLCYNTVTGKLEHEELIGKTTANASYGSVNAMYSFTVTKYPNSDKYAVLSSQGLVVTLYDGKHHQLKQYKAEMGKYTDGKNISSFGLLNAAADDEDNLTICYRLSKYKFSENNVVLAFLPKDAADFTYNAVGLGGGMVPIASTITYSASQVQVLVLNRVWLVDDGFYDLQANASSLCVFDRKNFSRIYAHNLDNDYCSIASNLKQIHDTANMFIGTALGIAPLGDDIHVISECVSSQRLSAWLWEGSTVFQNVTIRRLNASGQETRKATIFFSQYAQNFIPASAMMRRQKEKNLFYGGPLPAYRTQFSSYDLRSTSVGTAVILNDTYTEKGELITDKLLFDNHTAEAVVYLYDKNDSMTRHMLFPDAIEGLHHAVFLESAAYDQASDTYAALITATVDNKTKIYMSWSKLNIR